MYCVNPEDVKNDVLKVYREHKRFTVLIYGKYGKYCVSTVTKYFGPKMADVLKFFGIPKIVLRDVKISDDKILENLKKVYNQYVECGERDDGFSVTFYQQHGDYSDATVSKRFGSWRKALLKANIPIIFSCRPAFTKEFLKNEIIRFVDQFHFVPAPHMLTSIKGFPSDILYYKNWPNKSWREIMNDMGFIYKTSKIQGLDGKLYDSQEEVRLANILLEYNFKYEPHKLVCEGRKWRCDFYLPEHKLWVEYDGLGKKRWTPEAFEEKIKFYCSQNMNFVILYPNDNPFLVLKLMGVCHYNAILSGFKMRR